MAPAIGVLALGYLLGTISGAYLVARVAGLDIRRLGDGNVGAHNAMRHVGRGAGLIALLIDAAKGALAVWLGARIGGGWLPVIGGWLAIIGHNYPLWLRFRGGKGLATGLGVVLVLFPALWWLTLGGAALLIWLTRNLAFSGAAIGLALPVAAWLWGYPSPYIAAPLGVLGLLLMRQLPDLRRMWRDAPDKRDLILNRWIRDRDAKL